MTYSEGTGRYEADFLENILDTEYKYGIPYKINREKYEAVMKEFEKEVRIKDANVVVFHADYNKEDDEPERGIYSFAFFAWPQNSPEGSEDFYDCSQFWDYNYDYKHKEKFEEFVHAILGSVIGIDNQHLLSLINERTMERDKITREIKTLESYLDPTDNKQEKAMKEWVDENMSHGAFALTQDELDFYYRPNK